MTITNIFSSNYGEELVILYLPKVLHYTQQDKIHQLCKISQHQQLHILRTPDSRIQPLGKKHKKNYLEEASLNFYPSKAHAKLTY